MNAPLVEVAGQLRQAGQVTLNSAGTGVLIFSPDNARQRWVVQTVVVSSNQAATATVVPVASVAVNSPLPSELSQGNQRGSSWSGNQDTFSGDVQVGPADSLAVLFTPPPGATAGQVAALAGVICYATVNGTRHTRRA